MAVPPVPWGDSVRLEVVPLGECALGLPALEACTRQRRHGFEIYRARSLSELLSWFYHTRGVFHLLKIPHLGKVIEEMKSSVVARVRGREGE